MVLNRTLLTCIALVILAALVEAAVIVRAAVPAMDSVGFVAVAQAIDRDGLLATLDAEPAAPLFPWLVWLVHSGLATSGAIEPSNWGLCTQLVASLGLAAAVVPAYLLFRFSVSELAAATGGLFFCFVTVLARQGGDGLSDSTHLAFAMFAIWLAARYLMADERKARWLLGCGLLLGLALLVRSEAVVVVPALLAALAIEAWRGNRPTRRALAIGVGGLCVGLAGVLMPYLAVAGALRAGDTTESWLRRRGSVEQAPFNAPAGDFTVETEKSQWQLADGRAMAFGRKDSVTSSRLRGLGATSFELIREFAQSLNYGIGLLALFGLWFMRHEINRPIDRFLIILDLIYVGCAWAMSATHGYLAGRHLLLVVVIALPWGALGAWEVTRRALAFAGRLLRVDVRYSSVMGRVLGGVLVLVIVVGCLQATLVPLHASRACHARAVAWLGEHADRSAVVLDSAGYTALYSGLKTYRYRSARTAFCDPRLSYVVVERAELDAESERGATMRELLGRYALPTATFAPPESKHAERTVLVFRWLPEDFARFQRGVYAR